MFEFQNHRYSPGQIIVIGLQQAAIAAVALVASTLLDFLKSVAGQYRIAERIVKSVDRLLKRQGWEIRSLEGGPSQRKSTSAISYAPTTEGERNACERQSSPGWAQQPPTYFSALDGSYPFDVTTNQNSMSQSDLVAQRQRRHGLFTFSTGQDYPPFGEEVPLTQGDHVNDHFNYWLDPTQPNNMDGNLFDRDSGFLFKLTNIS
ncbi:hypothetical protein LTR93_011614 [Exophiala xenobiotica]|nr:hypothetical protein LTR93_011614 [Exophiala xenobiotica]